MKHLLLTTIAAVLLVGCGKPQPPDITIHQAVLRDNIEAVKQHLAAGTDVNAKNRGGQAPLHLTAMRGYKEIAELLLAKGADVNAKGWDGRTPLDYAIRKEETADLLRKHGGKTGDELKAADKPTAPVAEAAQPEPPTAKAPDISIHEATTFGKIEAVKQHIAAGTDVNAVWDAAGTTPLHHAAEGGRKEIAELLIENGADLNVKDETLGDTPVDWAIRRKHPEMVDLLRKHGGKTSKELKAEGK